MRDSRNPKPNYTTFVERIAIDCRKIGDFGIGTYLQGLLRGLAGIEGPEEFLLLVPPRKRQLVPPSDRFSMIDCTVPGYSIRELLRIPRLLASHQATLFHTPHYVTPFTALPTVVTIHDLIHLQLPRRRLPAGARTYARWMLNRAVSHSRAVLTPTEAVRRELEATFPSAAGKTRVTPNGIDSRFFEPVDPAAVLNRFGLERQSFFLWVGNDKPHKNLDRLGAAWERVRRAGSTTRLVLAGTRVPRLERIPGVIATGFIAVDDLRALYANALALVQPSLLEGFGLPVLEAMASGTAVIFADIPSLREVAGEAGIAIDPRSIDSIAEAMIRVAEDPKWREEIARPGRARARGFSWRRCASQTLAIYREIHRSAKPKGPATRRVR